MYLPEHEAISVEPKTVQAVLNAVLQGHAHTRNEIADHLNISSMTVGKVVRMLRHADLLIQREESIPRGRRPFCLYPSERLHSVTVYLTPRRASAVLCSADGTVLERYTVPYNDSLPWEGNLAYLRSSYEQMLARYEKRDTGIGVGVILREDCHFSDYALRVLSEVLRPAEVLEEDDLLTEELSRTGDGNGTLYVAFGKTVRPMLVVGGQRIYGRPWQATHGKDASSDEVFLDAVAGMLSVIPVSNVLAENRIWYEEAAERFLQALADRLPDDQKTCVHLHPSPTRLIAERGMERALRRRYTQMWMERY